LRRNTYSWSGLSRLAGVGLGLGSGLLGSSLLGGGSLLRRSSLAGSLWLCCRLLLLSLWLIGLLGGLGSAGLLQLDWARLACG